MFALRVLLDFPHVPQGYMLTSQRHVDTLLDSINIYIATYYYY